MEKLQKRKWLFLAAAVVCLVVWSVLGFSSRSSGPEAVVKKYLKACEKRSAGKAAKCYAPEFRKEKREYLKEFFANELEYLFTEEADYNVIVGDAFYEKGESETARVCFAVIVNGDEGGGVLTDVNFEILDLVKEGSKWYISE